jgi:hypothetical protein
MQLLSLNRSTVQTLLTPGGKVQSAIRKRPVEGPVAVHVLGLEGDEQADLTVHGGLGGRHGQVDHPVHQILSAPVAQPSTRGLRISACSGRSA